MAQIVWNEIEKNNRYEGLVNGNIMFNMMRLNHIWYIDAVNHEFASKSQYRNDLMERAEMLVKELEKEGKLHEWAGGTGFSMSSMRGGGINRAGFGGGSYGGSGGSLQTMYVYEIKPLNHNLEQKPSDIKPFEIITIGKTISGKEMNTRNEIEHEGKLIDIEKSEDGDVLYYVIMDPKTATKLNLDPTSVKLVDKNLDPDPLDLVVKRNMYQQLRNQMRRDALVREGMVVTEDIENYLTENLNESLAYYCATCGERAEHEEIEENPNMRCSNCGDRNWEQEH